MMQTILHRLNLTSGNIVRILTDATAVGIVAFSAKPIFDALKGREWNTLPVIGVPFLLGTFILSQRASTAVNYVDVEDAFGIVVEDFGELYTDLVHEDTGYFEDDEDDEDFDEEEAEGYY